MEKHEEYLNAMKQDEEKTSFRFTPGPFGS